MNIIRCLTVCKIRQQIYLVYFITNFQPTLCSENSIHNFYSISVCDLSEKNKIKTFKPSQVENVSVSSEIGNCENHKINLGKCIIEKNRYHPCPPAYREFTKQKVDNEWKKGLAKILSDKGIRNAETTTTNGILFLQIYNCNNEFFSIFYNYTKHLPIKKLPDLYQSLVEDFWFIQRIFYSAEVQFKHETLVNIIKVLKNAFFNKENLEIDDVIAQLIEIEKDIKTDNKDYEQKFDDFHKALKRLLPSLSPKNLENCVDEQKHQLFIQEKIELFENMLYGWL